MRPETRREARSMQALALFLPTGWAMQGMHRLMELDRGLAAALPAWMLLAPRDNISTYLKVGTVALLAVGILFAHPVVQMPAVTRFVDGSGPIFGGSVFPFCFIVIACGAISGFHSLICSGTTPRFVDRESDMRVVGYGAMLTESFVGVMSLIAAVTLVPGVYLAMNIAPPPGANRDGTLPAAVAAQLTERVSAYGPAFRITPGEMDSLAEQVQERSLYNRSGGGPSLAVGMARIFSNTLGGSWAAFWYHFAIMFEAVFILTVLDSGTRVIRFVVQELLDDVREPGVVEALARDIGLGLVDRLPPLKRMFMREAAGLTGDVPKLLRGEAL
jgi:carbon starvation protein